MFKFISAVLMFFSIVVSASQKEEFLKTFIGTTTEAGKLDELFGYDVKLINHYLYWEGQYGSQSLNIEQLIAYFNFYGEFLRKENCKNPFTPGYTGVLKDVVPLDTIDKIEFKVKHTSLLYPKLKINDQLRADLAVYELCQFSKFAFFSLPFDPAGIGGLNRNFEVPKSRVENICRGISHQIIKDVLKRKSAFSDNLKDSILCEN